MCADSVNLSNLPNYFVECMKDGAKLKLLENINDMKIEIDSLNKLVYDSSISGEEYVGRLSILIQDLNQNFNTYIDCRSYLMANY